MVSRENKLYVTRKRSTSPDCNYVGQLVGASCLKKGVRVMAQHVRPQITRKLPPLNFLERTASRCWSRQNKVISRAHPRTSVKGTLALNGQLRSLLNIPLVIFAYFPARQLNCIFFADV